MVIHPLEVIGDIRDPARELREQIPDVLAGYAGMQRAVLTDGALPARIKELIALAIAVGSGLRSVRAETPVPGASAGTSQRAAEALFVDAKRLIEKGSYADACAKFAESQRLGPAPGTLLNLADCYEKNGQLASAWFAFRAATTASEQIGRTAWAEQSSARARLLEPRLPTPRAFTPMPSSQMRTQR